MKINSIYIGLTAISLTLILACSGTKNQPETASPKFTKIDSLTDRYLNLQDSMLMAWNIIVHEERSKFRKMHELVDELLTLENGDKEALKVIEQRLNQVGNNKISQELIEKSEFIEEYDFATNSLIQEIITHTESHPDFANHTKLIALLEEIKSVDQRVENNRSNYDQAALQYNQFLEKHKAFVKEIDQDISLQKKALFQVTRVE